MKHISFVLLCALTISTVQAALNPTYAIQNDATQEVNTLAQKPDKPKHSETAQAVLAGVAHVAQNVGNIIKDPHNPHNVGSSVASMISGIINITLAAIKDKSLDLTDEEAVRAHLIDICEPMCEQITDMVVTKSFPS